MTSALSVLIVRLNVRIPATCLLFIFTCRRTSGDHLKTSAFNSWTSAFSCSTSEFRSSNESAVATAASWPADPPVSVSIAVGVSSSHHSAQWGARPVALDVLLARIRQPPSTLLQRVAGIRLGRNVHAVQAVLCLAVSAPHVPHVLV